MSGGTLEPNAYGRQLTADEIADGAHRDFIGGMWETMGEMQLAFLQAQGLRPDHTLLDIGCGALRGGVHFIRYLAAGNYYGLDINASLIAAANHELQVEGLLDKQPHLLVDSLFEAHRFGQRFDYAIAQSVFTHLPMNHIIRCLAETQRVLAPGGTLFATFFEAPASAHLGQVAHAPGEIVTSYDQDPYHYSVDEFHWMAAAAGLTLHPIGDWNHPRAQRMLSFSLPA